MKFHYNDRAIINTGFYKGSKCTIIKHQEAGQMVCQSFENGKLVENAWGEPWEEKYTVVIDAGNEDFRGKEEQYKPDELDKVKNAEAKD